MVWREEQNSLYQPPNGSVPDMNPRGCQKGACYSQRMYDAGRLHYPLKRAGERGEGKWTRISWDQAYDEISAALLRIRDESGPDSVGFFTSAKCTNEENYLFQKFARAVIGTNNVDHCARL